MQEIPWEINFAFPYPVTCTVAELREILQKQAAVWPGWADFPWRVTRNIHRFLDQPPLNFHYLMIHRCLAGYAAHLVLNSKFEDREAVLAMMLREKFEIVGVLRARLVEAIVGEMWRTDLQHIRDAGGHADGYEHVPNEELEKRRHDFRACVERAEREFLRIVNLASLSVDMRDWVLGRPLRAWVRGGELPDSATLEVQVEERENGKVLRPRREEVLAFARAGKPVPEVLVEKKQIAVCRSKVEGEKTADGGTEVSVVGAALTLAGALDGNPRVKAPNHLTVLKMFCLDEMSIGKIARKCQCTKSTVFNRKVALEKRLGQRLEVFRRMSGVFDQVEKALGDGRAKAIYRRGLVERSS